MKKANPNQKAAVGKKQKKDESITTQKKSAESEPNHKKRFDQLLDDAVLGIKKK